MERTYCFRLNHKCNLESASVYPLLDEYSRESEFAPKILFFAFASIGEFVLQHSLLFSIFVLLFLVKE